MAVEDIAAIRGATTLEADTAAEVAKKTIELMNAIVAANNLKSNDRKMISINISTTNDIKSVYPAAVLRGMGYTDVALFSSAEPEIANSLKLCIRFMVTVCDYKDRITPKHIYLHGAKVLRPDLTQDE